MLDPCSLPLFLSAVSTLELPEHSSSPDFMALPQSSMIGQDASPAWSFLVVSQNGSKTHVNPLFCTPREELLKPIAERAQPFLFDTSVAGESWGSEASPLGKPHVQL